MPMDTLEYLVDEADRLAQAVALTEALAKCLSGVSTRYTPRCASYPDSERMLALQDMYRAKDKLIGNLRLLDEQRNVALSPISRLDDDMLQMVLLLAVRETEAVDKRMKLAVAFSHVSRRWRKTAVESASLWVDIYVATYDHIQSQEAPWMPVVAQVRLSQSAMITAFLHRTRAAPLNLTIINNPAGKLDLVAQIFRQDMDIQGRVPSIEYPIRSFMVENCVTADVIALLQNLPDSVDSFVKASLKKLSHESGLWPTRSATTASATPADMLQLTKVLELKAPNLREFELCNSHISALTLPQFRLLETLVINIPHLSYSNWCTILSNYPRLRTLQCTSEASQVGFQAVGVRPTISTRQRRTSLEHLKTLVLCMKEKDVRFIVDHLIVPNLRTLSLSTMPSTRSDPILTGARFDDAISAMLQASGASLQELELYNIGCHDYLSMLQNAPELVSLKCGERTSLGTNPGSSLEQIAEALLLKDGTLSFNPVLETFVYDGDWRSSWKALRTMIKSRVSLNQSDPLVRRLLRVVLSSAATLSRDDTEDLAEVGCLLKDGLVVGEWEFRDGTSTRLTSGFGSPIRAVRSFS